MIVLAEYAHSNSKQFFTKIPPFHTKYTYQPRTSWPTEIKFQNPSSEPHGNIMMGVVAVLNIVRFNDRQSLMFGTVFIFLKIQKGLLVLGSIRRLVTRIHLHPLLPLPE
jgi:hypothetical protein